MTGFLLPPRMPTTDAALRDAENGSPEAKWVAALALGQENGPRRSEAIDALLKLMKSLHEEIRAQALEGISEQARHGAHIESKVVLKALEDPSPAVRAVALDTLAETDISASDVDIEPLLDDPDPSVRIAAAVAAAELEIAQTTETLRNMLNDPIPLVRLQAAISLTSFGDASGVSELTRGLALPPREALEAIRALGNLGASVPPESVEILQKIASKRFIDTTLKAAASVALCRCGKTTQGGATIAKLLKARSVDTRLTTLSAISGQPSAGLVVEVKPLLNDRESLVVSSAIETLVALSAANPAEAVSALTSGENHLRGALLKELREALSTCRNSVVPPPKVQEK